MFEMILALFQACFSKEHFLHLVARIHPRDSPEFLLIQEAYAIAEDAFATVIRANGKQYISHLRITAVLVVCVLWLQGKRNANLIAAALLHDLLEDFPLLWNRERLTVCTNKQVAQYVVGVTKPDEDRFHGSVTFRNGLYKWFLSDADSETVLLKLCDNTHNLLTLWARPVEKQARVISDSRNFYLPLAKMHNTFPCIYRGVIIYASVRLCIKQIWNT